jgi:hypothetical protein
MTDAVRERMPVAQTKPSILMGVMKCSANHPRGLALSMPIQENIIIQGKEPIMGQAALSSMLHH